VCILYAGVQIHVARLPLSTKIFDSCNVKPKWSYIKSGS
jgi:hypothetical protein